MRRSPVLLASLVAMQTLSGCASTRQTPPPAPPAEVASPRRLEVRHAFDGESLALTVETSRACDYTGRAAEVGRSLRCDRAPSADVTVHVEWSGKARWDGRTAADGSFVVDLAGLPDDLLLGDPTPWSVRIASLDDRYLDVTEAELDVIRGARGRALASAAEAHAAADRVDLASALVDRAEALGAETLGVREAIARAPTSLAREGERKRREEQARSRRREAAASHFRAAFAHLAKGEIAEAETEELNGELADPDFGELFAEMAEREWNRWGGRMKAREVLAFAEFVDRRGVTVPEGARAVLGEERKRRAASRFEAAFALLAKGKGDEAEVEARRGMKESPDAPEMFREVAGREWKRRGARMPPRDVKAFVEFIERRGVQVPEGARRRLGEVRADLLREELRGLPDGALGMAAANGTMQLRAALERHRQVCTNPWGRGSLRAILEQTEQQRRSQGNAAFARWKKQVGGTLQFLKGATGAGEVWGRLADLCTEAVDHVMRLDGTEDGAPGWKTLQKYRGVAVGCAMLEFGEGILKDLEGDVQRCFELSQEQVADW